MRQAEKWKDDYAIDYYVKDDYVKDDYAIDYVSGSVLEKDFAGS